MPIRINLLAESQAAAELRRRDPVKRASFAGALLVVLALVWSSSLELGVMVQNRELTEIQTQIGSRTNQWHNVLLSEQLISENNARLAALKKLSAARFLQGTFLDSLQHLTFNDVRLVRVHVNQSYLKVNATPAQTNNSVAKPAQPAGQLEKVVILLDAQDSSHNPGDQVNIFKQAVASEPYLDSILDPTNGVQLASLSAPQTGRDGRPSVVFTLQCSLPEILR